MNKKRILVLTLALSIIGTTSITTYAVSQNAADATKNIVSTVASKDDSNVISNGYINDDDAVKMAADALKDYFGVDANSFGEANITRTNAKEDVEFFKDLYPKEDAEVLVENGKKHTANVINIYFASASQLKEAAAANNLVVINEENGEIVALSDYSNLDPTIKTEVNDSKVKEAVVSFVSKLGKNIQSDSIKVRKGTNKGGVEVIGKLQDGRSVTMSINLKDYSVASYEVDYDNLTPLPSVVKDHEENFRNLQAE
ncbi:hypothetical protein [uncultured Clostridium sp.]|uniref:hypothetical protein n=1 Tax=uncultured Clostridium sp. TaxID=59620 RepID=UPI0028E52F4A|nr:hypothetical protein [uncultured Clostridium sp.]